jgi:hypothetical protein
MLFSIKNHKIMMLSASCTFGGQKIRPLHEMLTRLVITENAFQHPKNIWFHEC